MTHIICRALTCLFWEKGVCSAEEIEYEPDVGCLTFQDLSDLELAEEEEEGLEWEDEESEGGYGEEEDDWGDEEDWEEDREEDEVL